MVFTTSIFDTQLSVLTGKPKDGYGSCKSDIQELLCPLKFIDICNLDDVITRTKDFVLRKIRVPNSLQNWGKSQGFRLILLCDIPAEEVFLLYVYPKKGRLEAADLNSKGASILVEQFENAKLSGEVFNLLCEMKK